MNAPLLNFNSHTAFSSLMASTTAPQASLTLLYGCQIGSCCSRKRRLTRRAAALRSTSKSSFHVFAAQKPKKRQTAPPGVDTRIHWDNPDEGWIGGNTNSSSQQTEFDAGEKRKNLFAERFADLLNDYSDSHYQFLGVAAEADLEEIKAAYRRLSKEYHPDTTSLPIKKASDKFMRLKEIYDVLSNEEKRKFYDWTLAQEAASRQSEKMRKGLEDPFLQDVANERSLPDMVERLGGRNMDLSDQAMSALTIDVFIILFAIGCVIYVIFFKEPY